MTMSTSPPSVDLIYVKWKHSQAWPRQRNLVRRLCDLRLRTRKLRLKPRGEPPADGVSLGTDSKRGDFISESSRQNRRPNWALRHVRTPAGSLCRLHRACDLLLGSALVSFVMRSLANGTRGVSMGGKSGISRSCNAGDGPNAPLHPFTGRRQVRPRVRLFLATNTG